MSQYHTVKSVKLISIECSGDVQGTVYSYTEAIIKQGHKYIGNSSEKVYETDTWNMQLVLWGKLNKLYITTVHSWNIHFLFLH